ncbi:MAG: DEAD/DEAH box helicase [Flavobacteriales bacterium]
MENFAMQTDDLSPKSFQHLGLKNSILKHLETINFNEATPIQRRVIPAVLEKKNVIGIARTGTGKTAAFLLPIIDQWLENKDRQTLVLCPTKELASQIKDEFEAWKSIFSLEVALLTGGIKERSIKHLKERKMDVLVANPGVMKHLIEKHQFDLSAVTTLVLDEVDQLMEKSMESEVNFIQKKINADAQRLYFSATVPKSMKEKILDSSKKLEWIEIQKHISNKLNITEKVYYLDDNDKEDLLFDLLYEHLKTKTLLFFNDRLRARSFFHQLKKADFNVELVHGKKGSNARVNAINRFRNNEFNLLITTDVLGRGIDIPDVDLVINVEMPQDKENYEHRIGRTGRLGRSGMALTLCSDKEIQKFRKIQKLHKESIKEVYGHNFHKEMPKNINKTTLKNSSADGSNVHRLAWNTLINKKK